MQKNGLTRIARDREHRDIGSLVDRRIIDANTAIIILGGTCVFRAVFVENDTGPIIIDVGYAIGLVILANPRRLKSKAFLAFIGCVVNQWRADKEGRRGQSIIIICGVVCPGGAIIHGDLGRGLVILCAVGRGVAHLGRAIDQVEPDDLPDVSSHGKDGKRRCLVHRDVVHADGAIIIQIGGKVGAILISVIGCVRRNRGVVAQKYGTGAIIHDRGIRRISGSR